MDKTTLLFIQSVKSVQESRASASMMLPKADPFEHGVQVGVWQGLQLALSILDEIHNAENESEITS